MNRREQTTARVVWTVLCLGALALVLVSAGSCDSKKEQTGGSRDHCSSFEEWAWKAETGVFLAIVGALIAGWIIIAVLGRYANTRPCPRCGERVAVGGLECSRCGFDFNQIGQSGPTSPETTKPSELLRGD